MRKIIFFGMIAAFVSCTSNPKSTNETGAMSSNKDTSANEDLASPYPISYSSKFKIGDNKNAETILNLWKMWDNGDLSKGKDYFADSVEMHFWDGSMMHSTRDSVLASAQKFRSTFSAVNSSVDAIMP